MLGSQKVTEVLLHHSLSRPEQEEDTWKTGLWPQSGAGSGILHHVTLPFSPQHFVSERKYDEELGKAARFSCDIEQLKSQIMLCGESEFCILAK